MHITEHKIFRFTEFYMSLCDGETSQSGQGVYLVSTRKLEEFVTGHDFEYDYIEDLIEAAIKGSTEIATSNKYCFGDYPEWYTPLEPDRDCADPVIEIEVTVG